jgi:hypothetical protein
VSIALNPPNAKILYVATNDVVYKSGRILTSCMRERRKASFALRTKVSSGNGSGNPLSDPFISSILLHPRGPSQLYVGGSERGLENFRRRKNVAGDKSRHCDAQHLRSGHESQESADTLRRYERLRPLSFHRCQCDLDRCAAQSRAGSHRFRSRLG